MKFKLGEKIKLQLESIRKNGNFEPKQFFFKTFLALLFFFSFSEISNISTPLKVPKPHPKCYIVYVTCIKS